MTSTSDSQRIGGPARYLSILGNNELVALLGARLLSGVGDDERLDRQFEIIDRRGGRGEVQDGVHSP